MSAWFGLLNKELRLGRKFFYGVLIFMVLIALIGIGFAVYNPIGIVSMLFILGSSMLMFYLLIYLIVSLMNEKNSFSVWMQMPLPGWGLIGAKIVSGIIYLVVSTLAAIVLTLIVMQFDGGPSISGLMSFQHSELTPEELAEVNYGLQFLQYIQENYLNLITAAIPMILGASMVLGAGYLIFYTAVKVLQRWLNRWSILAAVIIVILAMRLYDWVQQSGVMELFSWGYIPLRIPESISFAMDYEMMNIYHESMSIGFLVFDLITLGLVVLLSGWLLDRKVEVR